MGKRMWAYTVSNNHHIPNSIRKMRQKKSHYRSSNNPLNLIFIFSPFPSHGDSLSFPLRNRLWAPPPPPLLLRSGQGPSPTPSLLAAGAPPPSSPARRRRAEACEQIQGSGAASSSRQQHGWSLQIEAAPRRNVLDPEQGRGGGAPGLARGGVGLITASLSAPASSLSRPLPIR
jgi:hypothetical protein